MSRDFKLFCVLVLALAGVMASTAPWLVGHIRVGLEFRGGYEMVFVAEPLSSVEQVTHDQLLQTATMLGDRANRLGVSEPLVNILGADQIRVELAGVSPDDSVMASLRDPAGLPVRLVEKYSETVGGVLGRDDLHATLTAGGIAVGLVCLFLAFVYRGPGLVAVFCVAVFLWLLLAAFSLLNATLSLAAIVAFVLGIGIASGADILLFERMREEMDVGKPIAEALRIGFRRSLHTILDANATVLICALVLFFVGIGPVTGFALTTILSIAFSLVANVLLARLLLTLRYGGRIDAANLFRTRLWLRRDGVHGFDYLRRGRLFVGVSLVICLLGGVMVATAPLNYDIEFKAGTALDIQIDKPISQGQATAFIAAAGTPPATVAIGGKSQNLIAARFDDVLDVAGVNAVVKQFKVVYGTSVTFAENTADPAAARHLAAQSIMVVLLALAGTFLFILVRFDWRVAVASMAVVLNAVGFVVTVFAVFGLEIDITFIAAILIVIGYALNEAIVVFDRIRETLRDAPTADATERHGLVNTGIRQVRRRSVYTVLTVLTGSTCLFLFGAEPLQMFSLAIFLGLVSGTFSSLCVAPWLWGAMSLQGRPPPTDG